MRGPRRCSPYERGPWGRNTSLTDDHPDTANSYNDLATDLHAQGKYALAQPLFEKALQIRRRLLTDDHPDIARGHENLATILGAQGKYFEARDSLMLAVKSLDAARLHVAFTGLEREATRKSAHLALAAVLARLGQPAEAWQPLEDDLGRGLLDELAARRDGRLTPDERARLRELTTELERLDKLAESTPEKLDQAGRARRFADLKHQRELASIALGEFRTKLVEVHGTLAGRVATLNEIQAALSADAALVAWVDRPPVTVSYAPSATVFKYLREQPRPDRHSGLLALGDPMYERLDKSSEPKPPPDHGLLVNVVLRGLNAANHGLEDGDVLLAYDGQRLNNKADLKVVADGDKPIAIEVWRDGRSSGQQLAPGKLGVMFDPRPAPVALVEQRKLEQVLVATRSGGDTFAPLPGTRYEVETIAQLFKTDGRPTRTLLGANASEPQLDRVATSGEIGQFGFIHLATHGVIDEAIPQRSAVILTQTGLPDPLTQVMNHQPVFDGRLSVREIQQSWDLRAELVTLSACETALGRDAGGEGFVGFTQALLMSGARSVCLSLWKVDDKATSLLMTRFYQTYFWAAFVLVGDPD